MSAAEELGQRVDFGRPAALTPTPSMLLRCAQLAEIAYATDLDKVNGMELWFGLYDADGLGWHDTQPRHISGSDAQCWVFEADTVVYIAFRGTQVTSADSWAEAVADLVRNFKMAMVDFQGGKAHRGYRDGWFQLRAKVQEYVTTGKPLILTGHSMGGALATVAACDLPASLAVTFGAPRPGNKALADSLRCPLLRFVHGDDIAAKHAPALLGYRHATEGYWLSRAGELRQGVGWFRQLFVPWPGRALAGVLDHRIGEYRRKLAWAYGAQKEA